MEDKKRPSPPQLEDGQLTADTLVGAGTTSRRFTYYKLVQLGMVLRPRPAPAEPDQGRFRGVDRAPKTGLVP